MERPRLNILDLSLKIYFVIITTVGVIIILVGFIKVHQAPLQSIIYSKSFSVNSPNVEQKIPPGVDSLTHFISLERTLNNLNQSDQNLSKYVRIRHLSPPSNQPYPIENTKLIEERKKTKHPLVDFITTIFNGTKGKFVDASIMNITDALLSSPTLALEKKLGWKGLVVACNPFTLPTLKLQRRKSWIADVCLSQTLSPEKERLTFEVSRKTSDKPNSNTNKWASSLLHILSSNKEPDFQEDERETAEVQMIPLFSLINAIGWKEIDFLSLEMKGCEIEILKNFPFEEVTFKVIQMGIFGYNEIELAELDELMEINEYTLLKARIQNKYRLYVHVSCELFMYENLKAYNKLLD